MREREKKQVARNEKKCGEEEERKLPRSVG